MENSKRSKHLDTTTGLKFGFELGGFIGQDLGSARLGAMHLVLAVGIQHEYPRWLQWASLPPLHGTRGAALVAQPQAAVRVICLANVW